MGTCRRLAERVLERLRRLPEELLEANELSQMNSHTHLASILCFAAIYFLWRYPENLLTNKALFKRRSYVYFFSPGLLSALSYDLMVGLSVLPASNYLELLIYLYIGGMFFSMRTTLSGAFAALSFVGAVACVIF